jgi:hypothetical protein
LDSEASWEQAQRKDFSYCLLKQTWIKTKNKGCIPYTHDKTGFKTYIITSALSSASNRTSEITFILEPHMLEKKAEKTLSHAS